MSRIEVPSAVRGICDTLTQNGYGAWVVGGCVRDSLRLAARGASAAELLTDWDIATSAKPEQVQKLFRRVIPTGIEHGTVTVLVDKVHYEVTTLRADVGYSDGRRPDKVEFVQDVTADLARRDFTVNAIAYDVHSDTLIDPFGGVVDLHAHLLRAVGEPAQRFAEDGLRVLRAARFVATLEFSLHPDTERAIRPSLGSYRKVSAERIRDEWLKALKAKAPSLAFRIMHEHGLLEITAPTLFALSADALSASLCCLDLAPKSLSLQLAGLLHRVAPEPVDAAKSAADLLQALKFSNQDRDRVQGLVRNQNPKYASSWSDTEVRRWLQGVGVALFDEILTLAGLIHTASGAPELVNGPEELRRRARQQVERRAPLTLQDLAIGGNDLIAQLGMSPGPELGRLLAQLLAEVLEDPGLNERHRLITRAAQLK